MNEFKGSKEQWWISGRDILSGVHKKIAKVDPISIDNWDEHKYNALLISKAPELLEELENKLSFIEDLAMLIPSQEWTESFRDIYNKEMHKLEKLIDEATTL